MEETVKDDFVELVVAKEDVADPSAGVRWMRSALAQCGGDLDRPDPRFETLVEDLAPIYHRLRDFLTVCPEGCATVGVSLACGVPHVVGVAYGRSQ